MPGFEPGLRPKHSSRAYAEHRERLVAATFPATVLVIVSVTLLYVFAVISKGSDAFRAELATNTLQLLVPLVALVLARTMLRDRVEQVALGLDFAYTALLAYRLFLPTANISGTALFLTLKMLATAVLFPWRATFQQASVLLTLILYVGGAWLSGTVPVIVHQWVGPIIAGIVSAVGAARAEKLRRSVFAHASRLAESEAQLRSALQSEHGLVDIAREISAVTNLGNLLQTINRRTAEALGCDFSTTLLLDERRHDLFEASLHIAGQNGERPQLTFRSPVDSVLAREILAGRTLVINDPTEQTWIEREFLEHHGVRRLALAPILAKGRAVGVLTAGRIDNEALFDERQIHLLTGLAAQSAVAIDNAQMFERLSASEAGYRDLFERANDLIFVAERAGPISFANRAAQDFIGVTPDALAHSDWRSFLAADGLARMERRLVLAERRGNESGPSFEVEIERADGSTAILELQARRISQPGQPHTYQCIGRDVTERRRQQQETQRLVQRLRESSRLQGEFVANMSHELRTPLNVIIGYTDLLMDSPVCLADREARMFLERITAAGRALHRLVESVLEYARLDRGKTVLIPTRFAADQLLLELRALSNDVRSSPEVELNVAPAAGLEFFTDYDRLYSILSNLLLNAIKFTPRGTVEVMARRVGDAAEFSVRDTGIGMEPEDLVHAFEPFRQIDGSPTRSFGGVGLGLAIVQRNLEMLGGSIEVDSQVGVGSTFRVRVPLELPGSSDSPGARSDAALRAAGMAR